MRRLPFRGFDSYPMTTITEDDVEQAALDWLRDVGWGVAHGPTSRPMHPQQLSVTTSGRSSWSSGCGTRWRG